MGAGCRAAAVGASLLISLWSFALFPLSDTVRGATPAGGVVDFNTTWNASSSPYLLEGDLFVTANATLTVLAGVEVVASGDFGVYVGEGARLVVEGNVSAPVVFRAAADAIPSWQGIRLNATAAPSLLANASVEEAKVGVSVRANGSRLERVRLERNWKGVEVLNATGVALMRSVVRWNPAAGVVVDEGAWGNLIEASIFEGNNQTWAGGLFLPSSGGGNLVVRNTFRNQTVAIGLEATNETDPDRFFGNNLEGWVRDNTGLGVWNASYGLGGNYWSDYAGADYRGGPAQDAPPPDGIGDEPRKVTGAWGTGHDDRDWFPRMCPNLEAYPDPLEDVDPPSIGLLAAPAILEFTGPVTVTAAVSDAHPCLGGGYANVTAPDGSWVNGTMAPSGTNFTRTFTPSELGTYAIDLWVVDAAGNVAHANASVDVVDTTTPQVADLLGEALFLSPWTVLRVSARLTDNHRLASVAGNLTDPFGVETAFAPNPDVLPDRYAWAVMIRDPGTYAFCFSVVDSSGLPAAGCGNVTFVDVDPPWFTDLTVTPGVAEVPAPAVVEVIVFDNARHGLPWIAVEAPSGAQTNVTMAYYAGFRYHGWVPTPEVGTYAFTVRAADTSGNVGSVNGSFEARDTTPPQLVALVPAKAPAGATVALDGSGSGDNTGIVGAWWTFVYRGSPVNLSGFTANFTFDDPGAYVIDFAAVDAYGNAANVTAGLGIESDDPPAVAVVLEPPIAEVPASVLLAALVDDDFGVAEVWAAVDGPSPAVNLSMGWDAVTARYARLWTFTGLGAHTVTVWARDGAGQWASAAGAFTTTDATPPQILGISLAVQELPYANLLNISAQAVDNHRVAAGWAEVLAENGTSLANLTLADWLGDAWTASLLLHARGNFTVCVTVADTVGLTANTCAVVLVPDTRAPSVRFASVYPAVVDAGDAVSLTVVVDDNVAVAGLWVNVSGPENASLAPSAVQGLVYIYSYAANVLGAYTATAEVVDASGLTATAIATFTVVDVSPPRADAGPDIAVRFGDTAVLDGSASSDNSGVVNFTWSLPATLGGGTTYGPLISVPGAAVGTFPIILRVRDVVNLTADDTVLLTVYDDRPPSIANVTAPASVLLGQALSLVANATDDDRVAAVFLAVNGGSYAVNFTATWVGGEVWAANVTPPEPGAYAYRVAVRDASGNWATWDGGFAVLDLEAPTVSLSAPATARAHTVVLVTVIAADNDAVQGVWLHRLDPAGNSWNASMAFSGGTWALAFTANLTGTHALTAWVVDASGNVASAAMAVTVFDDIAPTILTLAAPAQLFTGESLALAVSVSDNYDPDALLSVRALLMPPGGPVTTLPLAFSGGAFTAQATVSVVGTWPYEVQVEDRAGNRATRQGSVLVLSVPDTTPPMIAGLAVNATVFEAFTTVRGSAAVSDDGGLAAVTATLAGPGVPGAVIALPTAGGPVAFSWNVTEAGTYEVRLHAQDLAGHTADLSSFLAVAVGQPPVANAGADRQVPVGSTVTLDGTNSTDDFGINTYQWSFTYAGSAVVLNGSVTNFTFEVAGKYTVRLIVFDAAGRSAKDVFILEIVAPGPPGGAQLGPPVWFAAAVVAVTVVIGVLLRTFLRRRRGREAEVLDESLRY